MADTLRANLNEGLAEILNLLVLIFTAAHVGSGAGGFESAVVRGRLILVR